MASPKTTTIIYNQTFNANYDIVWSFKYALSGNANGSGAFTTFLTDSPSIVGGLSGIGCGYIGLSGGKVAVCFDPLGHSLSSTTPNQVYVKGQHPTNTVLYRATLPAAVTLLSSTVTYTTIRCRLGDIGRKLYVDYRNSDYTSYTPLLSCNTSLTIADGTEYYIGFSFVSPVSTTSTWEPTVFRIKNPSFNGIEDAPTYTATIYTEEESACDVCLQPVTYYTVSADNPEVPNYGGKKYRLYTDCSSTNIVELYINSSIGSIIEGIVYLDQALTVPYTGYFVYDGLFYVCTAGTPVSQYLCTGVNGYSVYPACSSSANDEDSFFIWVPGSNTPDTGPVYTTIDLLTSYRGGFVYEDSSYYANLTGGVVYLSSCPVPSTVDYAPNQWVVYSQPCWRTASSCYGGISGYAYTLSSDAILEFGTIVYTTSTLEVPLSSFYFYRTNIPGLERDNYYITDSSGSIFTIGICSDAISHVVNYSCCLSATFVVYTNTQTLSFNPMSITDSTITVYLSVNPNGSLTNTYNNSSFNSNGYLYRTNGAGNITEVVACSGCNGNQPAGIALSSYCVYDSARSYGRTVILYTDGSGGYYALSSTYPSFCCVPVDLASPSPSPSSSPSVSPSPSSSVSPSVGPSSSISPGVSPSTTPFISVSLSPTSGPSSSASLAPSTSSSPSTTPGPCISVSPSSSPSLAPSNSPSPSV